MFKSQVTAWKRLVLLLLLTGASLISRAQVYPVQLSTLVAPPYSIYLPDYASPGGEKLRLVLLQRDLTVQGYRLRFEMKVQVNGITIMQTSRSAVPPPITLQPGIPTVLGGSDLSWYVQPQNLEFGGGYSSSTYEQSRSLPEGPITITFTAYDYTRSDVQVSATASSFFYATRDNPPLLNYPACGMQVTAINPQFLNFSWLPQNTSSPNSALQTNYIFSLYTVLPAGYNFQDIVQSTRPVYSVTTQQPNLVYGPGEPPLVPGQSYAWRVQAVDASGRDIFRNNGYSETCNFIYSGDSSQGIVNYPPIQISAASAGPAQGKVSWAMVGGGLSLSGYDGYRLYYRKAQGDYDWFSVDVNDSMYRVFDLEPSTAYECRLQGHKNGSYGPYTDIANFTTDAAKAVGCTDNTSMLGTPSGRPLAVATGGMNITYGPWDVQLLTVQALSSPGQFKGTCKVTVPFMGAMTFNAKFDNLTIDDSRNVTAGNIVFLSQGLQAWIDSSIRNQMGGSMYGSVVSGTDTTNVTVRASLANLDHLDVIDSSNGDIKSFTIPGNPPVVVAVNDGMQELTIKDSSGNTYALDNQGNLTQLSLSDGSLQNFFADASNVAGLNTLASGVGTVTFTDADSKYAFDAWKPFYAQASTILTSQYEKLSGGSGDYYVPQKAIGAGESDIVGLNIDLPDNMDEDSLVFATGKGTRLIWDPKDYTLNLIGGAAADAQEVYALYPKPGGGYYSLGKLLVSAYEHQDFTAVLVPVAVGGAAPQPDRQQYEDALNEVYNKVNISWNVVLDPAYTNTSWDANGDGLLTMNGSSFFSNALTGEPAALAKGYKSQRSVDNSKRYIFLLNTAGNKSGDPGDLLGDMPRSSMYGFVFLSAHRDGLSPAATVAHELGHGQFNLEHTFSGDIALGARGATSTYPNLMDYTGVNDVHLYKYQWNQVHQPGEVLGIFDKDTAGQMTAISSNKLRPLDNEDSSYTFITPAGRYITLPKDVGNVYFSTYDKLLGTKNIYYPPIGSLISFEWHNNAYLAVYSGSNFIGYECKPCQASCDTCSVVTHYTETLSYANKPSKGIVLLPAVEDSSFVGYAGLFANPVNSGPQAREDGAGPVGKNIFIFGTTGTQLQESYKDYLKEQCGSNLIRITDGQTWIEDTYNVIVDSVSNLKVTDYLKATLNSNSTMGEILAQFALVFEGPDAIRLFKGCNEMLTSTIMTNISVEFRRRIMSGQERLTTSPLSKPDVDQFETDLANVGLTAAKDLEGASQVALQAGNAQSIVDIYNTLKQHYNECTLRALQLDTREAVLGWIFKSSNQYWSIGDSNIVYSILRTAPEEQRLSLAKDFMSDHYAWVQSMWNTVDFAYFTPVINILSNWAVVDQAQLNIPVTRAPVLFNNIPVLGSISDPVGDKPYLIGLENEQQYNISSIQTGIELNANQTADAVSFDDSGRVHLHQMYFMWDNRPTIRSADDNSQPPEVFFEYQETFDPFEPVKLIFVDDYPQLGVQKNTPYVVPAIWAFWAAKAQMDGFRHLSDKITVGDYIRSIVNTVALATALESGGESMTLSSVISKMVAASSTVDEILLEADKAGVIPASQLDKLHAWETFHNGLMIADGIGGLFKGADYQTISSQWNKFDNMMGSVSSGEVDARIVAAWKSLKAMEAVPIVSQLDNIVLKDLGALTGDAFRSGNVIRDKLGNEIVHLTEDGVLHVDALGNITEDSKILDIETNQTFVPKGSTTPVTEDLVISERADGTIVCTQGACFAAGTPIHTRSGLKPIENIRKGEQVLSLDVRAGKMRWEKVTALFHHTVSRLVRLVAGKDTLYSTPEHPYYTEQGWKSASSVRPGWKLHMAGGLLATTISTATIDTTATVYNFTVDRTHNYCIGRQGLIVHNDCGALLKKLKAKVNPDLYSEFASDFQSSNDILTKFDNGSYSIDAWEVLMSRPELRKTPAFLQDVTNCLQRASLQKLGLDKQALQQVAKALLSDYSGFPTAAKELEAGIFGTLSNFGEFMDANPGTTLKNFEKLVSDLVGGRLPARKGTTWILRDISENAGTFANKTIEFNVTISADGVNYYADVRLDVNPPIFIEYKSGEHAVEKQDVFLREFVKRDLSNKEVLNINQILWKRDVPEGNFKTTITGFLKSDEGIETLNELPDARKKLFFPTYDPVEGVTKSDIDAFLERNYSIIFKSK